MMVLRLCRRDDVKRRKTFRRAGASTGEREDQYGNAPLPENG